jgi:hypothetical protein
LASNVNCKKSLPIEKLKQSVGVRILESFRLYYVYTSEAVMEIPS